MYNHFECNVERPQTTSTTITDGRSSLVVFTPVVNSVGVDALHDSGDAKISTADQHHNPATLYTSVTANCCSAAAAVYRYHQTKAGLATISLQPAMQSNGRLWASGGHATPGHGCFERALGSLQSRPHPVQIAI